MAYIPKGNMVFFLYYVVGLDEEYLGMMNFKFQNPSVEIKTCP
jgi:hypothetical protein